MGDLGQELPFGHRDRLRLGVTGVHQALEHDGSVVDVVVERQVDPAEPTVRDTALDLVLVDHHVAWAQLRQKGIRTSAVRAPALGQGLAVVGRAAHRLAAVPAEPLGLGHHRIGHQRVEWIARRVPEAPRPARRRACGWATNIRVTGVGCSAGSVSAVPTDDPSESSKFGRNTAWVAIGRIVGERVVRHRLRGLGARDAVVGVVGEVRLGVVGWHGHQSAYLGHGRGGRGAEHGQPLAVQRVPRAVAADAVQRPVDEAHQAGVLQVDADAVGLLVHAGPDDVQVRILGHQARQDGVVGADGVDLALLQRHQAVGPRHDLDDDRRRGDLLDAVQRRRARHRAHPLAGQVRGLGDRRVARGAGSAGWPTGTRWRSSPASCARR